MTSRQIISRNGTLFIIEDNTPDIPFPPPAPHYVLVAGAYDSCFVGPFTAYAAANAWIRDPSRNDWDTTIMDIEEVTANVLQFGDCPLQTPLEFDIGFIENNHFCPECNSHIPDEPHSIHCSRNEYTEGADHGRS